MISKGIASVLCTLVRCIVRLYVQGEFVEPRYIAVALSFNIEKHAKSKIKSEYFTSGFSSGLLKIVFKTFCFKTQAP